jgi:hypothetical protein
MWALAVALGIGLAVANTPAVALAAPGDSDKGSSSSESGANQPAAKKGESSATNDATKPRRHPAEVRPKPKKPDETTVTPKKLGSDLRKGGLTSQPVVKTAVATRAPSAPTVPVQPAAFALLASTRREFEPSRAVTRPAAPTVTTSAVDPDFISSTHGFFGLFSVTSAADPDDNNYVAFVLRTPFFSNVLTSGTDPEDNLGFGAASIGVAGSTVNTFISPFLTFSVAIPVEDPFAELFTALVRAGF